jgi:hypothetical protein
MYTTSDLIDSIKKRGLIPVTQNTFLASDLIRFMDEELRLMMVPMIMRARENFFLETYDQPLVGGQSSYALPTRAIGMKAKSVWWLDQDGNPSFKMVQTDIDTLQDIYPDQYRSQGPVYFYFKDNFIEVLPTPQTGVQGSVRQYYFKRRNALVATTECGLVTQIVGDNVTINALPASFSTAVTYDFVKSTPGFYNRAEDQVCSGISGLTLTFTDVASTGLVVGDYICLSEQSPIPQIPYEMFPILSQRVVLRVLRGLNDQAGAEQCLKDLMAMEEAAIGLISVRSEDSPKIIASAENIGNYVINQGSFWRR